MNKTILLFFTLFCTVLLYAQTTENNNSNPYNLPLSNEEFFEQAELVVEGYFIEVVAGYNLKGTESYAEGYRIMALKVQKVYKGGQYAAGDTIYVTLKGGRPGMENNTNKSNNHDNESTYIPPVLSKNGITCPPNKYSPFIYFLVPSDFPDDENSKYFSYRKYKSLHKQVMHICGNIIVGLNDLIFRQREDFYNYMRQFEGFTVPELLLQPEKQPYNKAEVDSLHKDAIQKKWGDHKKKVLTNPEKSSEDITLTLQLANQQVIRYNDKQLSYFFYLRRDKNNYL